VGDVGRFRRYRYNPARSWCRLGDDTATAICLQVASAHQAASLPSSLGSAIWTKAKTRAGADGEPERGCALIAGSYEEC
jgi:hypothetical protein